MAKNERSIRVISMSAQEGFFTTLGEVRDWLKISCKVNNKGIYSYKERKGYLGKNCNPPGSIMLFKWKGQIIGEAIVEKDSLEYEQPPEGEEKFYITFEPSSIRLYNQKIPLKEIEETIIHLTEGIDKICTKGTTKISGEAYLYILSKVIETGLGFT